MARVFGWGEVTSLEVAAMAADREKAARILDILLHHGAITSQLQVGLGGVLLGREVLDRTSTSC